MSIEVDAIYEGGMLKPDRQLPLAEHQRVRIVVRDARVVDRAIDRNQDWWQTLQDILADQKKRGFAGTVTEVDRTDNGYEGAHEPDPQELHWRRYRRVMLIYLDTVIVIYAIEGSALIVSACAFRCRKRRQ